jgi:hypothetical protein
VLRFVGEPESVTESPDEHTPALANSADADDDDLVLDVEVVDPITPEDSEHAGEDDSAAQPNPFDPPTPTPDALMTLDAAVSAAAVQRRSVTLHRAQRALPPGR